MGIDYETIGRMFSRTYSKSIGYQLDSAGINLSPEAFIGFIVSFIFFGGLLLAVVFYNVAYTFNYLSAITQFLSFTVGTAGFAVALIVVDLIVSYILAIIGILIVTYVVIVMRADTRRRAVEEVFPDFLLLAASNVRAGMTVDQALWYAAKPEFGLLTIEIELLARRTFGGEPFDKAIDRLSNRFDSKAVHRAVSLIKQGMASGGEIANILERTGEETRNMQIIKKEISTSLLMYVIFIVFAAAIATPFLFAISYQLLVKLEEIFTKLPAADYAATSAFNTGLAGMLKFSKAPITSDDFMLFSLIIMTITILISSMIVGIIQKGSKKEGVKYFPFMWVFALILYFVVGSILSTLLRYMTY